MRKGIMAMEELDETRVDPEATPEEVPEATEAELTGDAPEAEAVAALDEAATGVVEQDEAIEDAADTADVVEEIRDNVAEAVETEGGVSEPEARALDVAVEALLVRIGVNPTRAKVFPAMEGFKDKESRGASTKIALEALSDKLKSIWAAIAASIKKIFDMVTGFVKSLVAGAEFLKARALLIKKHAAFKKGAAAGEISTKGWGAKASVGGKISAASIEKGVELLGTNPSINADFGVMATKVNASLVKILDAVGQDGGADIAKAEHEEIMKTAALTGDGEEFDLPMGGASLVCTYTKNAEGKLTGSSVNIKAGAVDVPEKVEGCTPDEAIKIADAVIKDLGKFAKYEAESGQIATAMKGLTTKVTSAMQKSTGDEQADQSMANRDSAIREFAASVNAVKSLLAVGSTKLRKYNFESLKAALSYAGASVSAAKKAGAKDDKKEPAAAAA